MYDDWVEVIRTTRMYIDIASSGWENENYVNAIVAV